MKDNRGRFFITMGLLLMIAAFSLAVFNIYDGLRAQRDAGEVLEQLRGQIPGTDTAGEEVSTDGTAIFAEKTELPDYVLNPDMEMPVETIDGIDYIGTLSVSSLGLDLPVISGWSYPGLRIAPCRYAGSAYSHDLVIAGHNYLSHFGNLKTLREGDEVALTDADGNVFVYHVVMCEILDPTAVEEMVSGDWDLTLFTCTIGGGSRVTIRCELAEDK